MKTDEERYCLVKPLGWKHQRNFLFDFPLHSFIFLHFPYFRISAYANVGPWSYSWCWFFEFVAVFLQGNLCAGSPLIVPKTYVDHFQYRRKTIVVGYNSFVRKTPGNSQNFCKLKKASLRQIWIWIVAEECNSWRSWNILGILQNDWGLQKIGVDTAENEPPETF